MYTRQLVVFFEFKPSCLNPAQVIRASPEFQSLRASINQTISDDFTAAKEASRVSEG